MVFNIFLLYSHLQLTEHTLGIFTTSERRRMCWRRSRNLSNHNRLLFWRINLFWSFTAFKTHIQNFVFTFRSLLLAFFLNGYGDDHDHGYTSSLCFHGENGKRRSIDRSFVRSADRTVGPFVWRSFKRHTEMLKGTALGC